MWKALFAMSFTINNYVKVIAAPQTSQTLLARSSTPYSRKASATKISFEIRFPFPLDLKYTMGGWRNRKCVLEIE